MLYLIHTAPSSGVRNITAPDIQPNSVTLNWNPPPIRDWNGELTNYSVGEESSISTCVRTCTSV